jgi:hypothetical protein
MVITVSLNSDTLGQSIINTASVGAHNTTSQSAEVCSDGGVPNSGVCDSTPQAPASSPDPVGVFLPFVIKSGG